MIELMKSTEFATALRNAMDMFIKLLNVVVSVFKQIMTFWNLLPNWAKDGIVWFVKIQMTLGVIAGIGQSILSTWIMIRGVMMGSWLSTIISNSLFYSEQFTMDTNTFYYREPWVMVLALL